MFQGVASKSKQTIVFNFHVNQKFKQSKVKSVGYLSKFMQPLKSKWNVENISHRGVPFYLLFKDFREYLDVSLPDIFGKSLAIRNFKN